MKLLKWAGVLALAIILVGCGKTPSNATPEKLLADASVVLIASEQEILTDTTMWTITGQTIFHTNMSTKVSAADIKIGDLISYKSEDKILESYPAQGTVKEVFLFDDEYSLKVSAAITSFLENQPEGDLLAFDLLSLDDKKLTAEIKKWNFEDDQVYVAEIDLETHAFEMKKRD
ncbi:DUF3221 domain-containing protein [Sporosarcina sp. G11-34]|uniref:DUF3221 domain-containing protein n=1 Tax=Sporosarcina sp. G11-34 TaxID=2849605 RepID=UPI0022A90935|nr:DUF3221 domain-containing protein [Sporosarcina sp. G11-34]MCZ2259117.1 YobA family protein [Sporosarcina sp. G11-34]